jgi:parvulin-like peptidyl-prolyl isomerase
MKKPKIKRPFGRNAKSKLPETGPLKITNETVAAHREEILGSARKYIYPLRHSKHRMVVISISVFSVAIVVFFTYCVVSLYKLRSDSTFLYHVTQVVPFPIARTGSDFIAYENYLFEINHYTHYYQTQQKLDFKSTEGKQQLAEFKKRALEKVIDDAYVKKLAKEKGITVSDREVDNAIAVVRSQNRLGSSDKEFESVLKEFWNWSVQDFRRSLKSQLLEQKVVSALDTDTHSRAEAAYAQLQAGKDFSELAKAASEDTSTKANGGDFGFQIDQTNRDVSPQTVDALFKLQPGQYSGIIDVGYGLEIVKNIDQADGKVHAAHIIFNFKDINTYLNDIKDKQKTRAYVHF